MKLAFVWENSKSNLCHENLFIYYCLIMVIYFKKRIPFLSIELSSRLNEFVGIFQNKGRTTPQKKMGKDEDRVIIMTKIRF